MSNSSFAKTRAFVHVGIGLVLLQLGMRGLLVWLNESGGNTFDIAGSSNGPRFLWMLVPESDNIDVFTRFAFWLLLPAGLVLIARSVLNLRSIPSVAARRLGTGALLFLGLYVTTVGVWGGIVVLTGDAVSWEPPTFLFPEILYLVIHKIWFVCVAVGMGLILFSWRRMSMTWRSSTM